MINKNNDTGCDSCSVTFKHMSLMSLILQTGTWRRMVLRLRLNEVRRVWFYLLPCNTWRRPTSPSSASEPWLPLWCHPPTPLCCLQPPSSPQISTRTSWGPRWGGRKWKVERSTNVCTIGDISHAGLSDSAGHKTRKGRRKISLENLKFRHFSLQKNWKQTQTNGLIVSLTVFMGGFNSRNITYCGNKTKFWQLKS